MCDIIQDNSLIITEQPIFSSFLSNIWKELSFWIDLIVTVVKFHAKLVELNQLHLTWILTSFCPQPTFSDTFSLGICKMHCISLRYFAFFTMPKLIVHNHLWHKTLKGTFLMIFQQFLTQFTFLKQHFNVFYHLTKYLSKDLTIRVREDFKLEVVKFTHFHFWLRYTPPSPSILPHTTPCPSILPTPLLPTYTSFCQLAMLSVSHSFLHLPIFKHNKNRRENIL